jgi:hypothetical protein
MPKESSAAACSRPQCRSTEGKEHRYVSRDEALGRTWLTWRSRGLEHGLKPHKIGRDGSIQETGDRADGQVAPRKRPKAVSSRQWGRC